MTSQAWPWPAPVDDGGARHLMVAHPLADVALAATTGGTISPGAVAGIQVLFVYPWTGRDGLTNPPDWDMMPGAHGSTPQAQGFADLHERFRALGVTVLGLSAQDGAHQRELAARLRLPFPILSDADFWFADAMGLPRFATGGVDFLRRLTIVANKGRVIRTFYPVHPPDRNAADVLGWLEANPSALT